MHPLYQFTGYKLPIDVGSRYSIFRSFSFSDSHRLYYVSFLSWRRQSYKIPFSSPALPSSFPLMQTQTIVFDSLHYLARFL